MQAKQAQGSRIALIAGASIGGSSNGAMLEQTKDASGNEWIVGLFDKRSGYSRPNVGSMRKDATAATADTSEALLGGLLDNGHLTPIAKQMVPSNDLPQTLAAADVIAASKNWDYTNLGTISPHTVVTMQFQRLETGMNEYCFRRNGIDVVHAEVSDIHKAGDGINYVPVFQMKDEHGSTVTIKPDFVPDLLGLADGASSPNAARTSPVTKIPTPERLYITNFESEPCTAPTGFFMRMPGSGEVKVGLGASAGDRHVLTVALHMSQEHIDDINLTENRPQGLGLSTHAMQAKINELQPLLYEAGFRGSLDLAQATYHSGLLKTVVTVATNPIDGNLVEMTDAALGGSAVGGLGATVAQSKSVALLRRHVTDPRFGNPQERQSLEADFRSGLAEIAEVRHESMGPVMRKLGFYDEQYEVQREQAMQELRRWEPAA
jgi:hypothetical protein